jgi:ESS family glutamate:Na+ symporter
MTIGWLTLFVTQALVGLLVITVYKAAGGAPLSDFLGMAAPIGFCQGAGQAIAIGQQWESQFNVDQAVNFGLIYASIGFFASFLFGVPAARWAIRKGLHANTLARLDDVYLRGLYPPVERPSMGQQVTHSANIDSQAYSLGILGVAYLLTNQFLVVMQPLTAC